MNASSTSNVPHLKGEIEDKSEPINYYYRDERWPTLQVRSIEPEMHKSDAKLNWQLEISPWWPTREWIQRPFRTSHTLTVLSKDPVIIRWPCVSKSSETISAVWPSKVWRHSPVSTSHNRAVLSIDPVAIAVPWGLKDKHTISVACPRYVWYSCPVSAFHSLHVLSVTNKEKSMERRAKEEDCRNEPNDPVIILSP